MVLRTGETALIRPITPEDREALRAFHERQSPDSRYRRYFSPKPQLSSAELDRFCTVDFVDRAALVVELRGEMVGWSSYERWANRPDADAAFMVDDAHHGAGIATLMLEHLAAIARSNGIERFTAEVLADNRPMLAVFARAGWPIQRRFDSGVIDLEFDLADTEEFIDSVERREQRADSRAMARLLIPRSIAVIGASERMDTAGQAIWTHLNHSFNGSLYAVNPAYQRIGDHPCCSRVTEIAEPVDLAVIAVPHRVLKTVIDDCIAASVRGAIIVTSIEGSDLDMADLVQHCRANGLRLIGPASFGIASPAAETTLQAALVDITLPSGSVALSLQSGTLASSVLAMAAAIDLGLSWFVSLGDKCDVSANDLLQFWDDDDATRVIGLYTESLGNPAKFARIARRVSLRRPIVAVRTGAALIGPAVGALYEQAGVIEVPTVAAMLDTVRVLATQPPMNGDRVAVISNARSPGVLATTALETAGLRAVTGSVALDWSSSDDDYGHALETALNDESVDAVLVIHAPPDAHTIGGPVEQLDTAGQRATKPIVAVMLGAHDGPVRPGSNVQRFAFPEPAAAVLGRLHAYSAWRRTEAVAPRQPPSAIDRPRAAAILEAALAAGVDTLDVDDLRAVLDAYGIAMATTVVVDADAAGDAARRIGYPVAIKALERRRGHSTAAGVALDLRSDDDVMAAIAAMTRSLGDRARYVIVQQMVEPGADIRLSCTTDARLGPVVSVGLGGLDADAIGDTVSRLAPVSSTVAALMLARSRASAVLDPEASEQLVDATVRFAQLVSDHTVIAAFDMNPVIVNANGVVVVDAAISLDADLRPPAALRRLG